MVTDTQCVVKQEIGNGWAATEVQTKGQMDEAKCEEVWGFRSKCAHSIDKLGAST
jgi:hypothetical protein